MIPKSGIKAAKSSRLPRTSGRNRRVYVVNDEHAPNLGDDILIGIRLGYKSVCFQLQCELTIILLAACCQNNDRRFFNGSMRSNALEYVKATHFGQHNIKQYHS